MTTKDIQERAKKRREEETDLVQLAVEADAARKADEAKEKAKRIEAGLFVLWIVILPFFYVWFMYI